MAWLILIIVIVAAGVWQFRTHQRSHKFGSPREEMDALRREINRQRHP